MKNVNKFVGIITILNVIVYLIYIINSIASDIIVDQAEVFTFVINSIPFLIIGINIIFGIINLIKKNFKTGIINIVIALIVFITGFLFEILNADKNIVITVVRIVLTIALSIVNIILNRKSENNNKKILIIGTVICVAFFVIEMIPFMMCIINRSINVSNFEKMISEFKDLENLYGFKVIKFKDLYTSKDKEFIYYSKDGNILNRYNIDDDLSGEFYIEKDNNKYCFEICKIDNDIVYVAKDGSIIFKYNELVKGKDSLKNGNAFLNLMVQKLELDGGFEEEKEIAKRDVKNLKRYNEERFQNEENQDFKYMYFKNENISENNILQIEITNYPNNGKCEWISLYTDVEGNHTNSIYNRDIEKINEFYQYDKNYYLIDTTNGNKIQLQCKNILYDAYKIGDEEVVEEILLLSDGSIPFYDFEIGGNFSIKDGHPYTINSNKFILMDSTEKYNVVLDKELGESYFISKKDNAIIRKSYILEIYNEFYVEYTEEGVFYILDKDLNIIKEGRYLNRTG